MTRQSEILSLSGFVLREAWRDAAKTVLLYAVTKNPLIGRPLLRAARSGRLPERVFSKLPAAGVFTVSVGDGASFRYAATRDDGIGRYLYWRGLSAWESATTRMFFAAARRARVVVDVGANTGIYTLLACAASPHCRVVAFEPVPRVFRRLEENIALNGWQGRCEARCEAIADRDGVVPFHNPPGASAQLCQPPPGRFSWLAGRAGRAACEAPGRCPAISQGRGPGQDRRRRIRGLRAARNDRHSLAVGSGPDRGMPARWSAGGDRSHCEALFVPVVSGHALRSRSQRAACRLGRPSRMELSVFGQVPHRSGSPLV